jgi:hypothetical protein
MVAHICKAVWGRRIFQASLGYIAETNLKEILPSDKYTKHYIFM